MKLRRLVRRRRDAVAIYMICILHLQRAAALVRAIAFCRRDGVFRVRLRNFQLLTYEKWVWRVRRALRTPKLCVDLINNYSLFVSLIIAPTLFSLCVACSERSNVCCLHFFSSLLSTICTKHTLDMHLALAISLASVWRCEQIGKYQLSAREMWRLIKFNRHLSCTVQPLSFTAAGWATNRQLPIRCRMHISSHSIYICVPSEFAAPPLLLCLSVA